MQRSVHRTQVFVLGLLVRYCRVPAEVAAEVRVAGLPPTPGTSVYLMDGDRIRWTQVVEAPHCLDPGHQDPAALLVSEPWPEEGRTAAAIVAPHAAPTPGADLDGDGRSDALTACATADGGLPPCGSREP